MVNAPTGDDFLPRSPGGRTHVQLDPLAAWAQSAGLFHVSEALDQLLKPFWDGVQQQTPIILAQLGDGSEFWFIILCSALCHGLRPLSPGHSTRIR